MRYYTWNIESKESCWLFAKHRQLALFLLTLFDGAISSCITFVIHVSDAFERANACISRARPVNICSYALHYVAVYERQRTKTLATGDTSEDISIE